MNYRTCYVKMSVTVNNNSPIQDHVHPNDHTQPTYEMTPTFHSRARRRNFTTKTRIDFVFHI